jgi:hypothetical protein
MQGPDVLVRLPEPVNKFPEFVAYLVKRLKILCPSQHALHGDDRQMASASVVKDQ